MRSPRSSVSPRPMWFSRRLAGPWRPAMKRSRGGRRNARNGSARTPDRPLDFPGWSLDLVHKQGVVIGIIRDDPADDDDAVAGVDQVVRAAPLVGEGEHLAGLEKLGDMQGSN